MLKQVHFAGIKSLLDVTVDLEPFTVIVGPNGCGKSTLLDQIELIVNAVRPNPRSSHVLGALGDLLAKADPVALRTAGFEETMIWRASWAGRLQLSITTPGDRKESWADGTTVVYSLGDGGRMLPAGTESAKRAEWFSAVAMHFPFAAQRLRLVPRRIATPCPVEGSGLQPDGFGLATVLKDLATDHTDAYLALQRDLRSVLPHFRELKIGKEHRLGAATGIPVNSLDLAMSQGRFPAHQVSDGTLIALALLTAVHNPDLPKLVLMDDIDHGLHLGAQVELIHAIRRVMQARPELQVICTSHSPYMLGEVEVAEVRVANLDRQGNTIIKPLADHPEVASWSASMNAGELWANLGEAWVLGA